MFYYLIRFFISISLILSPYNVSVSYASNTPSDPHHSSHVITTAHQFNQDIESLNQKIFKDIDSKEFYVNHPLDTYSLIHQTTPHPQNTQVALKNILVEVLNTNGTTKAVLSSQNLKSIIPLDKADFYVGPTWNAATTNTPQRFQISYQGQVIHTFANTIQWISFVGPYLVFMEPSQFEKTKAFISFIDLKYFEQALSKTPLPIFRIPVPIDLPIQEVLLSPTKIMQQGSFNQKSLSLQSKKNKRYNISLNQLGHLSHLQQTAFNMMVSLVSVERYERDFYPFIEEMLTTFQKTAESQKHRYAQHPEHTSNKNNTPQALMDKLVKEIKQRLDIGSSQDLSGHYGKLKQAHKELKDLSSTAESIKSLNYEQGSQKDLTTFYKTFSHHLEQDQAFQSVLKKVGQEKFKNKKILERLKGLYLYLTMPQPMGAAKIQTALGLMAGTVRSGEHLNSRFLMLKESLSQIMAHKKARMVGASVLIGAGYLAHPVVADFYHSIFLWGSQWCKQWMELIRVTFTTSTSFIDPNNLHATYIANGNYIFSTKGVIAIMAMTFGLFGALHLMINTTAFIKHLHSNKVKSHQEKANQLFTNWKNQFSHYKKELINFTNQTKKNYIQNLSNIEWRNIGLKAQFSIAKKENNQLAQATIKNTPLIEAIFQTGTRWHNLLENYEHSNFKIHIDLLLDGVTMVKLTSINPHTLTQEPFIKLQFHPPGKKVILRYFTVEEDTDIHAILKDENKTDGIYYLQEGVAMHIRGVAQSNSKQSFIFNGNLINGHFSLEEEMTIQNILQKAHTEEQKKSFLKKLIFKTIKSKKDFNDWSEQVVPFSQKEVTTFSKALLSLFSYAHWTYSIKSFAHYWNESFLFRNLLWKPSAGLRALYYSNYFTRLARQGHKATVLNGGFDSRINRIAQKIKPAFLSGMPAIKARAYLVALHDFEDLIIKIERQYLQAVAEQGLLEGITYFMKNGSQKAKGWDGVIATGVKENPEGHVKEYISQDTVFNKDLNLKKLKAKERYFMELYTKELFNESMRDFIKSTLFIPPHFSDKQARLFILEKIKNGKIIMIPIEDMETIRKRVRRIALQENIAQRVHDSINHVFNIKNLFKNYLRKNQLQAENTLNRDKNIVMQRYMIAEESMKDPEALARVTRFQLAKVMIDKPVELVILLLVLAGVDEGILKILHKEAFSEDALFHLSRVAVWTVFFSRLVLRDMLGAAWMKLQIDARLGTQDLFKHIPTKEDINKKFASFRLFWKHFNNEQNSLTQNYKYLWKIIIANIGAAVFNYAIVHALTLGRFDIDLFLNEYLIAILPFLALQLKMENTFEMSANLSLKNLIKKGMDFTKNRHWLAHPDIQLYRLRQGNKLRRHFNILYTTFYNNPGENILSIFGNINTEYGTRAFQRQFLFGSTLTEYWVNIMNYLEQLGVPSKITSACKIVFTKNRSDLNVY